jgi:hypothetical protein
VQPLAELVGFGGLILPFGSDDGVESGVVTPRRVVQCGRYVGEPRLAHPQ